MVPGDTPLVTNSTTIPAYYVGNDVPAVVGLVVSTFGHTHYISEPFIPSDVMVLKPLDGQDISPEFGLYLATQLTVAFSDADYVNAVTLKQLKETEIEVPVTENGEIDYDAVSDKMRPIMEKAQAHVDKLAKQYEQYKRRKSNG